MEISPVEVSEGNPDNNAENVVQSQQDSKDGSKNRRRDDKNIEQVLRTLSGIPTTEEKLAVLCKKYSELYDENKKGQAANKQSEKRVSALQKEKEHFQSEHSKAVLARSRLENLCRELQRQNKTIKDESLLRIREEEEKRKEVSNKFQTTLNEITTLMQQNSDKTIKLREENLDITQRFKGLCEQYELREQQVEKLVKQLQLETQLGEARMAKAKMEMASEKEILLREKQELLLEITEYQKKYQDLQQTEVALRSQVEMYTDKYDEFQQALTRSNQVFNGFKDEMERMSKKIHKLEKETQSWKTRWEGSHKALLEMAADKQQRDAELGLASRQLAQLQKLCRALQAERTLLLGKLSAASISKPETSDITVDDKIELLDEKCELLKERLNEICERPLPVEVQQQSCLINETEMKGHVETNINPVDINTESTEQIQQSSVENTNVEVDTSVHNECPVVEMPIKQEESITVTSN